MFHYLYKLFRTRVLGPTTGTVVLSTDLKTGNEYWAISDGKRGIKLDGQTFKMVHRTIKWFDLTTGESHWLSRQVETPNENEDWALEAANKQFGKGSDTNE